MEILVGLVLASVVLSSVLSYLVATSATVARVTDALRVHEEAVEGELQLERWFSTLPRPTGTIPFIGERDALTGPGWLRGRVVEARLAVVGGRLVLDRGGARESLARGVDSIHLGYLHERGSNSAWHAAFASRIGAPVGVRLEMFRRDGTVYSAVFSVGARV